MKGDINGMKNTERFGLILALGGMLLYTQASKKMFELYNKRINHLKAITEAQFDIIEHHAILILELQKR